MGKPEEGEVVLEDSQKVSLEIMTLLMLVNHHGHHRTAPPWYGSLSHYITYIHPRAKVYAGAHSEVCLSCCYTDDSFMSHPEVMLPIPSIEDPVQRFVEVLRFYMAGWHIRPAGVRKPLNPILGEFCTGYWNFEGKGSALYIAEQVSHHVRHSQNILTTASYLRLFLPQSRKPHQS